MAKKPKFQKTIDVEQVVRELGQRAGEDGVSYIAVDLAVGRLKERMGLEAAVGNWFPLGATGITREGRIEIPQPEGVYEYERGTLLTREGVVVQYAIEYQVYYAKAKENDGYEATAMDMLVQLSSASVHVKRLSRSLSNIVRGAYADAKSSQGS